MLHLKLISVTFQHVYTTVNDPYTQSGSQQVVFEFRDYWNTNRQGIKRDVAVLFSEKSHGVGGWATKIGVICKKPNQSYAFVSTNTFQTLGSSELATIHEISHTLGGEHSDGTNCGSPFTLSLMCPTGPGANFDYSSASLTKIGNYISNNSSCLTQISDATLAITGGDEILCSGTQETYQLTNGTLGSTVNWSKSGNLSIVSSSSDNITVQATSSDGAAWIEADVTFGACTNGVTVRKTLWVGTPVSDEIIFSNAVGGGDYFCSSHTNNEFEILPSAPNATYQVRMRDLSTNNIVAGPFNTGNIGTLPNTYNYTPGWYLFEVRGTNSCGTTSWAGWEVEFVDCSLSRAYNVFPNPSSTSLTIAKNQEITHKAEALQHLEKVATYNLYNMNSEKILSGRFTTSITLSISELERGRYILEIQQKDNAETHHIVIE